MAIDTTRLSDAMLQGILSDPDGIRQPGDTVPTDNRELRAMLYYIAKAVKEEIDTYAELNATTLGVPGVVD